LFFSLWSHQSQGVNIIRGWSQTFYDRVWSDEATWFSEQFIQGRSTKDEAIVNQWTFFVQHMGGPALFDEWRNPGGAMLVEFTHMGFRMSSASMKRWMTHMRDAVESSGVMGLVPEATEIFLSWCEEFGQKMIAERPK
jgi:truncated hemoglobin YjbI